MTFIKCAQSAIGQLPYVILNYAVYGLKYAFIGVTNFCLYFLDYQANEIGDDKVQYCRPICSSNWNSIEVRLLFDVRLSSCPIKKA